MKLIRMHVDNFGCLHDFDYEFRDGLNVILHDNGWGKTTMASFLKAMLYGFDTRRSKDITENERKRYLPWQGGKYGGSLDFEASGRKYRIFRTFGETPRFDKARLIDLDSGDEIKVDADKIGETLFHLDANAFQRSVYINQNGLSIDGAASSIHTRLNSLVSQANDVAAFDDAIARLTAQVKVYEKAGSRGLLGDATRQIAANEHEKERLEEDIAAQDQAREHISKLDALLGAIARDIESKKKKLDEVSGEAKKREAAAKLIEDLKAQIAGLDEQLALIADSLGGDVPDDDEIEQAKRQSHSEAALTQQLNELSAAYEKLSGDYSLLLQKYNGQLPVAAQLDEIQSIYGTLQGIRSAETEEALDEEPEGYSVISEVAASDAEYIDRLTIATGSQMVLQQRTRKLEEAKRNAYGEQEAWTEKKKRYAAYASEVNRLKEELDGVSNYAPEAVDPVMAGLYELQNKQRTLARQAADQAAAIDRERDSWAERKQRHEAFAAESEKLKGEVTSRAAYRPEAVDPVIAGLDELQNKQRALSRQAADQTAAMSRERDSWADKKQRFARLSSEASRLREECGAAKVYRPEAAEPVIAALESQQEKQRALMQQEADLSASIKRDAADRAESKQKYAALKEESDRLEAEVQSRNRYEASAVRPAIDGLETIRKQEQLVNVRKDELDSEGLTAAQEALLKQHPGELPDVDEANAVLKKLRGITQKKSDAQAASAKLSGEKSRAGSLKASIDQLENAAEEAPVEEPKKSAGTAMICAGAAIAVIGAVLIFVVAPFMAIAAAVGAALAIVGVASSSNYKKKLQAYETYKAAAAKRQDARNKKAELINQLDDANASCAALQKQIDELNAAIAADRADVDEWAERFAPGGELTESRISEIIENTEQVTRLRRKKKDVAEKEAFVAEKSKFISEERGKVESRYPELKGLSTEDALDRLRSAETEAKLYAGQLQTAKKNLEKFLAEAKLTEAQLRSDDSPALADMRARLDNIRRELSEIDSGRKALNAAYPEIAGMSYDDALRLLRSKASDYKLLSGGLQAADSNLESFLDETKLSADQFSAEESPAIAAMREKLDGIQRETEELESARRAFDDSYPEIIGLTYDEALKTLRAKAGEYKIAAGQLQAATQTEANSAADAKVDAALLSADESPLIFDMQAKLDAVKAQINELSMSREQYDLAFPEIGGMTSEDAIKYLRGRESSYRVINGQLQAALRNLQNYLADAGFTEEQLAAEESPHLAQLTAARDAAAAALAQSVNDANEVLSALSLDTDAAHIIQALREAEQMLNEYKQYAAKLKDRADRSEKKQQQIRQLQEMLDEKLTALQGRYDDADIPARLKLVREDISNAALIKEKLAENERDRQNLRRQLDAASEAVKAFTTRYVHFDADGEDALSAVYAKAGKYTELTAAKAQLEKQCAAAGRQDDAADEPEAAEETALREQISDLEARRDALLVEYTQQSDFIRQADKSLEKYPDILAETSRLYEKKQQMQNTLFILKRTIRLITRAKENLANRYLGKVERMFNSYLQIWLQNDTIHGILDIDFKISMEDDQKVHLAEGYSTGYCDLIDLCMRLALVDTLFEGEKPFLILDDPFVNLDEDRLNKSMDLLQMISSDKQIIYFVCHPVRSEAKGLSNIAGKSYAELMQRARKAESENARGADRAAGGSREAGRERYHVVPVAHTALIKPSNPGYIITTNIFDLGIETDNDLLAKDASYELFFIDEKGHVLNERLNVEMVSGKLSASKLRFCLNVRAGSGDRYELIVRRSDQPEYEILGRTEFKSLLSSFSTLESRKSFFVEQFRKSDILDITPYIHRYGTDAIKSALRSMEDDLDIVEFEENQYINIRRLEKAGVKKQQLLSYGDEVRKATAQTKFFTVKSLKLKGFTSGLDELGFGNVFYESLLSRDKRFAKLSIGKTPVFSSMVKKFSAIDFLAEYMNRVNAIDVDSLLDDLNQSYGIAMTRSSLLTRIKDSALYYDKILDYIYKDYETYYRDV